MNPSDSSVLIQIAEEIAARYRRGEHISLDEYVAKYPRLAEGVRDLFPALLAMEKFGSVVGPATGAYAERPLAPPPLPERLGEYRILREVARGGMGVVYEAVQESLGRHVALKVLPAPGSPTQLERFRREARAAAKLHHTNIVPVFGVGEDQGIHFYAMQFIQGQGLDSVLAALKQMRKSGQAAQDSPVAEGGPLAIPANASGDDFLLVDGRGDSSQAAQKEQSAVIASAVLTGHFPSPEEALAVTKPASPIGPVVEPAGSGKASGGSAPTSASASTGVILEQKTKSDARYYRSVAQLGIQVAEALAHAHQQGILHRDIKPANLLLDTRGTVWITDFGLAKHEGSDELTSQGDIVGTLRYMAPERFQGQADARSDLYSLGLTLYELLTFQPAFAATDKARLIELVLNQTPPRPRLADPHVPRDLEIIVQKAMARAPEERYPSGQELADDLRRFLDDKPIRARRPSFLQRFTKWARRHRAVVTTAVIGVVAALAILGGAIGWMLSERAAALALTTAEVNQALEESAEHQRKGRIPKALDAVRTAQAALASGRADDALSARVQKRLRDLQMVAEIEDARLKIYAAEADPFKRLDLTRLDAVYARLFEKHGINVEALDPHDAAQRIKDTTVSVELAAALDNWASCRWLKWKGDKRKADSWKSLLAIARAADPNPVRNRIRDLLETRDTKALAELTLTLTPEDVSVATVVQLAEVHLGNPDPQGPALALLRRTQRLHPDDFWVNHQLGLSLLRNTQPPQLEDGIRFFSNALACRPDSAAVWVVLGNALAEQGKFQEAEASYRRALDYKPDYGDAYYCLGNCFRERGELDKAKEAYLKAIAINHADHGAHVNLGSLHFRQKKWAEAALNYRAAQLYKPDDVWIRLMVGQSLLEAGELDKAAQTIQQLLDDGFKSAEIYYVRGRVEDERENWPASEKLYLQALKGGFLEAPPRLRRIEQIEPAHIHFSLGGALFEQKKLDAAGTALRETIRLNKHEAKAHHNLGLVYVAQENWPEAHQAFAAALALKKDYPEAHCALGSVLLMLGKRPEAIAHLEEAIKQKKGYGEAHFNLGVLLQERGDLLEAVEHFEAAIADKTNLARAHHQLGQALYQLDKLPEAEKAFLQAVKHDGKDGQAYYHLGLVVSERGRLDEAEKWYRKAIDVQAAEIPEAHCNLAHLLVQRGEFVEALKWFRSGHEYGLKIPPDGGKRAKGWRYPSERWVKEAEELVELDKKLTDVLKGDLKGRGAKELCELAAFSLMLKRQSVTAARLYAEGLAADEKLSAEARGGHFYDAGRAAALAGAGKGPDSLALTDEQRAQWRKKALDWLRAAYTHWTKRLEDAAPLEKADIRKRLAGWQKDADLTPFRHAEGAAADKLWGDVQALLKKADAVATALAVGSAVRGTLDTSDPTDSFPLSKKSHRKVHAVRLEACQPYLIDLKGDFDPFLRIEDSKSKPLLFNDDIRPDDFSSRLVFVPAQDGDYHVIVTSFKAGDAGSYVLGVQKAVKVGKPTVVADMLHDKDMQRQERFFKSHKVSLSGGSPYTITLESDAFDTVLLLWESGGKQPLADNDDVSPGNTRLSRLDFTPKVDGVFSIEVTSFGPGETGAYRLTIQRYEALTR